MLKLQAPPRRSWFARTFEARTQASREKKDLARKANFVFRRCAAQQGRGSGNELARRHGCFEEKGNVLIIKCSTPFLWFFLIIEGQY